MSETSSRTCSVHSEEVHLMDDDDDDDDNYENPTTFIPKRMFRVYKRRYYMLALFSLLLIANQT